MNVRTQGFTAEHYTVKTCIMLFASPVSHFNCEPDCVFSILKQSTVSHEGADSGRQDTVRCGL